MSLTSHRKIGLLRMVKKYGIKRMRLCSKSLVATWSGSLA